MVMQESRVLCWPQAKRHRRFLLQPGRRRRRPQEDVQNGIRHQRCRRIIWNAFGVRILSPVANLGLPDGDASAGVFVAVGDGPKEVSLHRWTNFGGWAILYGIGEHEMAWGKSRS